MNGTRSIQNMHGRAVRHRQQIVGKAILLVKEKRILQRADLGILDAVVGEHLVHHVRLQIIEVP